MTKIRTVRIVCLGLHKFGGKALWTYAETKNRAYLKATSFITLTSRTAKWNNEIGRIYTIERPTPETFSSKSIKETDDFIKDEKLIEGAKFQTEALILEESKKRSARKIDNSSKIKKACDDLADVLLELEMADFYDCYGNIELILRKSFIAKLARKRKQKNK